MKAQVKSVGRYVLAVVVVIVIALLVLAFVLWGPKSRQLDISVAVVDAETGRTVPNAKVTIITDCYYLINNAPRVFMTTADESGYLHFEQQLDYAIGSVTIIAWNADMTKRGVSSRENPLQNPVPRPAASANATQPSALHPNVVRYRVAVNELSDAELQNFRMWHEDFRRRARYTTVKLARSGIEAEDCATE